MYLLCVQISIHNLKCLTFISQGAVGADQDDEQGGPFEALFNVFALSAGADL